MAYLTVSSKIANIVVLQRQSSPRSDAKKAVEKPGRRRQTPDLWLVEVYLDALLLEIHQRQKLVYSRMNS